MTEDELTELLFDLAYCGNGSVNNTEERARKVTKAIIQLVKDAPK